MKHEFKSVELKEVSGVSKRTGKPFSFNKQKAYVSLKGEPYPLPCWVIVDGVQPFAPGVYDRIESEHYVDKFGSLETKYSYVPAK